jgi:hypothetical protein
VNVYDTDPNVPDNPNNNGGDLAPRGAPDGMVDMADYMILQRIVLGEIQPSAQELVRGDVYPPGAPDGVVDMSDLILLLERIR